MKNIVIVGKGGFGREVEWLIERINSVNPTWNVLGYIDNNLSDEGVIGDDDFIINYEDELHVAIAIGNSKAREKIYNKYIVNPNIKYPNLIDPSVLFSSSVKIGIGNIICAGTIMTVDISIGNCNIRNLDCTVGHDSTIANFVTINPSVNISGNVRLGKCILIGTGTQIIQGLAIGDNSIVGAGAVVNKNLPHNCTAVGVPAKVIRIHEAE